MFALFVLFLFGTFLVKTDNWNYCKLIDSIVVTIYFCTCACKIQLANGTERKKVAYAASSWDMVEVLLASEHYGNDSQHSASDDFHELFDEFAERQGIHFNKRNFRELETNINGLPVAKYGLRGIDCEEFRNFLSGIKAQKYHLQYASVKCGPMTFSFCMAFACEPFDFGRMRTTSPAWATTASASPS